MTFRLEDPVWLWLAAAILPLAIIAWLAFTSMGRLRRWSAIFLRLLLLASLAAMLAGITSIRRTDRAAVIAVIDVSGSVRSFVPPIVGKDGKSTPILDVIRQRLSAAGGHRGADDLLGVVVFDQKPAILAAPSPGTGRSMDRSFVGSGQEGSDLAGAIRLAAASLPVDATGRLIIFSDGNQTTGDAAIAAREVAGGKSSIPIDVVPLGYSVTSEVIVEGLDAPTRAAQGSVASLRVILFSTTLTNGTLHLLQEEREVNLSPNTTALGRRVSLAPGRNVLTLNVPLGTGRIHRFEAIFEPDRAPDGRVEGDTIEANNHALAFTTSPGAGSVLLVDGVGANSANSPGLTLANVLKEQGIEVVTTTPEGFPDSMLRLQAHDLVILENVGAETLGEAAQQNLTRYVTELGGGLVMIGGPDSFGAGGWKGTPVEPILPVTLDLPDRLVMPGAAVVLILDSSGSMAHSVMGSSRSQQEIANRGAVEALRRLDSQDLIGVIQFDSFSSWVVPLAPNTKPADTAQRIMDIAPHGGTNLPPAMEKALAALKSVKAGAKHVIVLTDGVSQGRGKLAGLAKQMRDAGIKLSTIAVGDDCDTRTLEAMAVTGDGEFFHVIDPNILPRVFMKAVQIVRTPMIREVPFTPVLTAQASPLTQGLRQSDIPPLGGLTLTQPKLGADKRTVEGVTYAMLTPGGEPVLSHWQAGLGQVAAFTSDAHNWAKDWQGWGGYRTMWTQVVRTISRPSTSQMLDLAMTVESGQVKIRMEAADAAGKPIEGLNVPASVYSPSGDRVDVKLTQTASGVYEGAARAEESGTYVVTTTPRNPSGSPLSPVFGGVVKPPGEEYRRLHSDEALLAGIAKETGGRVLTLDRLGAMTAAELYERDKVPPKEARTPLWPVLVLVTIVLLLLDVGTRRVAWDRYLEPGYRRAAAIADEATPSRLRQRVIKIGGGELRPEPIGPVKRKSKSALDEPLPPTVSVPEPGAESPLMAAKRRARERMDEER